LNKNIYHPISNKPWPGFDAILGILRFGLIVAANASGSQAKHAGTHLPGLPMTSGWWLKMGMFHGLGLQCSWDFPGIQWTFIGFNGGLMEFDGISSDSG